MNITSSKIARSALLGSFIALCALGLRTQVLQAEEAGNHGQLSAHDYKFVSEAAQGGTTEVSLSQMAAQKATDPGVREFAQRMVQDHQKANQELTQLVSQKGATLTESAGKKDEKVTEHLQNLSGAEFDKAYMKIMVSDHKKTVKLFQKESENGEDADLKSWATKTLPTLQDHLVMAQTTEAAVVAKP